MSNQDKRLQYLAKASAAEALAFTFPDGLSRQNWLNIAEAYRELAAQTPTEPTIVSGPPV